jgi:hypothetical protein
MLGKVSHGTQLSLPLMGSVPLCESFFCPVDVHICWYSCLHFRQMKGQFDNENGSLTYPIVTPVQEEGPVFHCRPSSWPQNSRWQLAAQSGKPRSEFTMLRNSFLVHDSKGLKIRPLSSSQHEWRPRKDKISERGWEWEDDWLVFGVYPAWWTQWAVVM